METLHPHIKAVLGPVPYLLTGNLLQVNGNISSRQLADLKKLVQTVQINGSITGGFSMVNGQIFPHDNA